MSLSRREFLSKIGRFLVSIIGLGGIGGLVATHIVRLPPPKTFKPTPSSHRSLHPARWWEIKGSGVRCQLCPFGCFLPEGGRGRCRVRTNLGNELFTLVYAYPVALHIDPIEKKPVYHLLPGSGAFSLATAGCNLRCKFCQNWTISQVYPEEIKGQTLTPQDIVKQAKESGCRSIAYTYTEPIIFYEYVHETASLARQNSLYNVLVSAGYINREPLKELAPLFDIIKIDLKGFNPHFYRQIVGGELKYVLDTLVTIRESGVLTEVVNLVVPTLNDNPEEIRAMCRWLKTNLGADTPLFFSRFTPQYRLSNLPPTPLLTLERARETALEEGLNFVYLGNVPGHPGENTYCPECHKLLIHRYGYAVLEYHLQNNRCAYCGRTIPGIWYKNTA